VNLNWYTVETWEVRDWFSIIRENRVKIHQLFFHRKTPLQFCGWIITHSTMLFYKYETRKNCKLQVNTMIYGVFSWTFNPTLKFWYKYKPKKMEKKELIIIIITRGPWATSLTWVTLAHMKIFFEFEYTFHFLLFHLTFGTHDFNKLPYVQKMSMYK
jgi:hypothetical protein